MNLKNYLKNKIESIWMNEIKQDYENDLIVNEDTLKMCFCNHLREKLKDLIKNHRLRIISEYRLFKSRKKVDIAIVELFKERNLLLHYNENVKIIHALIELKFIPISNYHHKHKPQLLINDTKKFDLDLFKLNDYGKRYTDSLLIAGFIHEYPYNNFSGVSNFDHISDFFDKNILDRIIELDGFKHESLPDFFTKVIKA